MAITGHKGHHPTAMCFSTTGSIKNDFLFYLNAKHKARQRAYFISGRVPLNLASSCLNKRSLKETGGFP
ncbi:hypothetical protein ACFIOY_27225 [Bradyrhizobium sp. TZ2]